MGDCSLFLCDLILQGSICSGFCAACTLKLYLYYDFRIKESKIKINPEEDVTKSAANSWIKILPGLLLSIGVMLISLFISEILGKILPFEKNPVSPMLVTIVIGLLIRNLIPLPEIMRPGIGFGIKRVLRLGIILMGIRLSLGSVLKIGVVAVGLVFVCIAGALLIVYGLSRLLKVNSRLGMLIAAGTSICGVSAIIATSPAIGATEEETAYAVGVITIFGLLATAFYPFLVELVLHFDVYQAGFFLGTSIHDTSQVTAASLIYNQLWERAAESGLTGADIAITTKLVRNTFMIAIIPLLGLIYKNKSGGVEQRKKTTLIPLFVIGYLLMGGVRTLGDIVFVESELWVTVHQTIKEAATYIIAVAVASVSLNTQLAKLKRLGFKPLLVGLIAALSLGLISFILVNLFHARILF
ncbi:MAG: putative sulfate exporter family transporter [Bacteroidetes bacterium]|nr:putative sulfate exporter family transporter [Bacteroidota bacterium]